MTSYVAGPLRLARCLWARYCDWCDRPLYPESHTDSYGDCRDYGQV